MIRFAFIIFLFVFRLPDGQPAAATRSYLPLCITGASHVAAAVIFPADQLPGPSAEARRVTTTLPRCRTAVGVVWNGRPQNLTEPNVSTGESDKDLPGGPAGKTSMQQTPGFPAGESSVITRSFFPPKTSITHLQPQQIGALCVPPEGGTVKTGVCPDAASFAQVAPSMCLDTELCSMSSRKFVSDPTPKSVLGYLRDQMERCRLERRPDLERVYEEAWQLATNKVYGPLPPRWNPDSNCGAYPPLRNRPVAVNNASPQWREEFKARPLRKIVARDGLDEVLECGHRQWHYAFAGDRNPKRRRCLECGKAVLDKKQATGIRAQGTGKKAKAVSA